MSVVVATRTKMSKVRYLPGFMWGSLRVAFQVRRSAGYLAGRLVIGRDGSFWTLTVWESGRDMVGFRESGTHAKLMPFMAGWASEALFGVWNSASRRVPKAGEVSREVQAKPNFLEIVAPSLAHLDGRAPAMPRAGLVIPIPRRRTKASA